MLRRIVILLLGGLLAGGSGLLVLGWVQDQREPADTAVAAVATTPAREVLVAAAKLDAGTFVTADALQWQAWPEGTLPSQYVLKGQRGVDDFAGAVVRYPLAAGAPVTDESLVRPGDRGFLAAVLAPGMRAVSVRVDDASGNAGLVAPGDHVDLVLMQLLGATGEGGPSAATGERRVAQTVLADLRVLAMGRRLKNEAEADASGTEVKTITLEVTPVGAEQVALASELGKLTLSLRSLADDADAVATAPPQAPGSVTWDTDVSPVLRPENLPNADLTLVRGSELSLIKTRSGGKP